MGVVKHTPANHRVEACLRLFEICWVQFNGVSYGEFKYRDPLGAKDMTGNMF